MVMIKSQNDWVKLSIIVSMAALVAVMASCFDDPELGNDDPIDDGRTTHLRCDEEPPEGAEPPPELMEYTGGDCPAIEAGFNQIESSGEEREFLLLAPEDIEQEERLPVIFLWHWLAGSAESFANRGNIQEAVDEQRFLAVIPENKGDLFAQWPYLVVKSDERVEEELTFFDDMLTCVDESYGVNRQCVSSSGISAGALWTSQLAWQRSQYLSSFIALSGGVHEDEPGATLRPWKTPERQVPGLVLWGGEDDWCIVDFEESSTILESHLEEEGSFFVECVHNCGHTQPPTETDDGLTTLQGFWEFALDHPLWVKEGTSPYQFDGLPEALPNWCAIGMGNAQVRDGECDPDECQ